MTRPQPDQAASEARWRELIALRLPEGSRAEKLLARMNNAYQAWAASLPEPLQGAAQRRRIFTREPGKELLRGPSGLNPGLTCTPWLFWDLCRGVEDERFVRLATAGSMLVLASVLQDHLVDEQSDDPAMALLLKDALWQQGLAHFQSSFSNRSGFWDYLFRLSEEHRMGLAREVACRRNASLMSDDTFCEMVRAKFAPIVITMAAFLIETGMEGALAAVEESIKSLALASQWLDDLGDWKEDLAARRPTYFLQSLAPDIDWQRSAWPSAEDLQARIDDSWLDLEVLQRIKRRLGEAERQTEPFGCEGWSSYLEGYRRIAEEHARQATARHLKDVIEPLIEAGWR